MNLTETNLIGRKNFYEVIQKKIELPEWFGKNPDALWDMLTGHIELPCEIILIGFDKKENGYNNYKIDLILSCFTDAEKYYPTDFKIVFKTDQK